MSRPQPLLTVQQAADYLGCSDSTVRRRVDEGKLKCAKLAGTLRFKLKWLDDYRNPPPRMPEEEAYALRMEAELEERGREGIVYIIQGTSVALAKIGYSSNFWQRYADLQACSPDQLRINCILFGGKDLEGYLHQKFSDDRQHGEWFDLSDPLIDFIRDVRIQGQRSALEAVGWSK